MENFQWSVARYAIKEYERRRLYAMAQTYRRMLRRFAASRTSRSWCGLRGRERAAVDARCATRARGTVKMELTAVIEEEHRKKTGCVPERTAGSHG